MKIFVLLMLLFQIPVILSDDNSVYKIVDIGLLDDGTYYFKIENNNEKAVIIETNPQLEILDCIEIKIGKYYNLNLEKIKRNYRGKNDKFVLISDNGTQTTVWKKEDGYPLLLYKAKNIKDLCIGEQWMLKRYR